MFKRKTKQFEMDKHLFTLTSILGSFVIKTDTIGMLYEIVTQILTNIVHKNNSLIYLELVPITVATNDAKEEFTCFIKSAENYGFKYEVTNDQIR